MRKKLIFNGETPKAQYEELLRLEFGEVFKIENDYETVMRRITEDFLDDPIFKVADIVPGTSLYTVYGPDHLVVINPSSIKDLLFIYFGSSLHEVIVDVNSFEGVVKDRFCGDYVFPGGLKYQYICIPLELGVPKSFLDLATCFNVPMQKQVFTIFVNQFGRDVEYNVWRSFFQLRNSFTIRIN